MNKSNREYIKIKFFILSIIILLIKLFIIIIILKFIK